MKTTAKLVLLFILTMGLLFSCVVAAEAELLFGVSAETGTLNFSADYDSLPLDTSGTPSIIILDADLNLFIIHINAEYGTTTMGADSIYLGAVKAGWELGPGFLKAKIYGAYRAYGFVDDPLLAHAFGGLVANLGVESKLGKIRIYGDTDIPLMVRYTNGVTADELNIPLSYLNAGVAFSPLPLLEIFVNYRSLSAGSSVVDISATGTSYGVRFSF